MNLVLYDGSYEGLLTAIFEIYEYKIAAPSIVKDGKASGSLFGNNHKVETDKQKAKRVLDKLKAVISMNACKQLHAVFLSEANGVENRLFGYIQYVLATKGSAENDYSHKDVLYVQQMSQKVYRERHRMEAFVRFQLTKDQLYYSLIQPDFNVLPLLVTHFKNRYADQRWMIYDVQRKYGIYYDLHKVEEVQINFTADLNNKNEMSAIYDESEMLCQELWQHYFGSVNIAARKNIKLHIQHMPKRYWKYLVEKK